jgi:hypothetical protein
MPAIHHVTEPMPEAERNARVYAGEIVVFRGFAAVAALVEALQAHCREHLGTEPERVHTRCSEAEANEAAEALRQAVMADTKVAQRLHAALEAIGMDRGRNFGDGLKQRVQLAHSTSGARMVSPLGAHRDTWATNIMAQTNWWAPTFPTAPERTVALFPGHFERAVANDSAGWDFRELVRRMKEQGSDPDYPLLPLATAPPPWEDGLAVSLVPGDLMCFSGAHLHASVPNATARTRLSFETRTVNGADVAASRGAPNVDGRAERITYQLFRRLADGAKLGEMA